MDTQTNRNEAAWRAQMLAGQSGVRQSISELGFLVSGLFLAYLLSEYWPGLAIVVAAAMCAGAIFAVWRESRVGARLSEEFPSSEAEQPH
jgi:Flp pilus assembly protein TadB